MGFSSKIKDDILVKSARHCCVCRRFKGLKIEVHHITPKEQGGEDSFENAIALCFDCHSDAGHYFAGHPKGKKLSSPELAKHKEEWFKIVQEGKVDIPKDVVVDIIVDNMNFEGSFQPQFIKEKIIYVDRDAYKEIFELTGKNSMDIVKEMKQINKQSGFFDPVIDDINSYDDLIDFFNGDFPEKGYRKTSDENTDTDCQPINYFFSNNLVQKKEINLSNCILNLKLINYGSFILEDYKVYLKFENVVKVDSVSKSTAMFDLLQYNYNVRFIEDYKAEFFPERNVLVQNDSVSIDPICFRTKHNVQEIKIHWELLARGIQVKGVIDLKIDPVFEIKENHRFISSAEKKDIEYRVLPKKKTEK